MIEPGHTAFRFRQEKTVFSPRSCLQIELAKDDGIAPASGKV